MAHPRTSSMFPTTKPPTACLIMGCLLLLLFVLDVASARAILGIDLGSSFMKVALVRPGSPLEIVTNLHSKRKTENMILFDNGQRFYGADAAALLARKSTLTAERVSLALGRDEDHAIAKVLQDHHHPVFPKYNETRYGLSVSVAGVSYTPEELTAMVLSHAHEIAVQYAAEAGGAELTTIKDCVITVPSFCTDAERRSYLDAAKLAGMNVLVLMDETVAAAVQYSMDKTFADGPVTMLFYNMGAASTQVAIVKFEQGSNKKPIVTVLAKAWDETLGGAAFDHVIVQHIVEQYNAKRTDGFDVRTAPRAMAKLRLEANKIKHVLSANTERPVQFDHDDVSVSFTMTRAKFQELAADLLKRVAAPVQSAMKLANVTNIDTVELLGGGMRVPAVLDELETVMQPVELGKHMNADEAFALGSAFVGANASTAFRVRKIGLTDIHPYAIDINIQNLRVEGTAAPDAEEEETWSKSATIFKAWGKIGVKKTIAFSHDQNVVAELLYQDGSSLERYNITGIDTFAESKKDIGKPKVSLQFELSTSGITTLVKAEAIVEETYTVEEEIEVEDDDEESIEAKSETEDAATEETETKMEDKETDDDEAAKDDKDEDANAANATNTTTDKEEAPKKKMKKVTVEKEKKRTHKQPLTIDRYYVGRVQPHSPAMLAESKLKLDEMDRADKERILLEASRNKLESFIYKLKNELVDKADEIEKVTNEKQRNELAKLSADAEEWFDDIGYKADLATAEDKYAQLFAPYEMIQVRIEESTARPEALEKLRKKLEDVEKLMEKWEETKPHITEEERKDILEQVKTIRKWADDNEKKQSKKKPHETPVFLSTEVGAQLKPLERAVVKLGKKPAPKPKVEKKTATNSTTDANATAPDVNATEDKTEADSTEDKADEASTEDKADEASADDKADEASADDKADEASADEKAEDATTSEDSKEEASSDEEKEAVKEEL